MIPIQELLNRIRWDESFGKGDFEIGYYDRVDGTINRVPLSGVHTPQTTISSSALSVWMGQFMRFLFTVSSRCTRTAN